MKPKVDYALYLVTDSTAPILGDRDLVEVVEEALLGGRLLVHFSAPPFSPTVFWIHISTRGRSPIGIQYGSNSPDHVC